MRATIVAAATALLLAGAATAQTGGASREGWTMQPKVVEARDGAFRCEVAPQVVMGHRFAEQAGWVVQPFLDRIASLPAGPPARSDRPPEGPRLVIGLTRDLPELRKLAADLKPRLPKGGLGDEGFIVEVTPERMAIAAEKPAGAFYGVLKLVEMAGPSPGSLDVPATCLADWPTMRWRGMHVLVNGKASLPALERLLAKQLPLLRTNRLVVEVNYGFQYRSHPEVAEADGLTVEDARRLRTLADRSFVELIPMINCLGHQSWAKDTGRLLTAHPELDETPDLPADNPGIYCRSWCPSNPAAYGIVNDLFDELIDAFRARTVHVGMDEVFILGKCPLCKGTPNAELFARAVNGLHAHLVGKRRLKMLMWGDRLLDAKATGYGEWEASANDTARAIDLIPKDVVACDWHYETPADFPSVRYFQQKGIAVWPSGWNSDANVRLLAGCALKSQGPLMLGYLATTWTGPDVVDRALSGDEATLKGSDGRRGAAGLLAGIQRGARMAWQGAEGAK